MVGLISALILIPLAGAIALYIGQPKNARTVALIFNALSAFYALLLWQKFDATAPGLQIAERHAWIPSIGAEYLVGVDGLSVLLVLLTSLVFPFAFCAQRLERGACALMLVMQAALYGTFTAQNFVLWFLFYEMSLVPAFLLIKIYVWAKADCSPAILNGSPSPEFSSASPSKSRFFHFTPGCLTLIKRRRPACRWC